MEPSTLPGGMLEMLGLEMPLQQPQPQPQPPQNPHHIHHHQHPHPHHQITAFAHPPDLDHHPQSQSQPPLKHGYPYVAKAKQQLALSDEDEPGLTADDSAADGKRKVSPWHRMKWTDNMVRLLIMAVFYIGDEGGSEGSDPAGGKKKAGGLLQKKGKWKSVSRAMMEKGFYVSPQQCEDKFNDLNKRYKRVNDILGKGTACRVVENQSLLDNMDQLSPKMKDEVRKLLNSKHLFFREMCAYHNSCGGGGGGTSGAHHSPPETATEPEPHPQPHHHHHHHQQYQSQQRCLHSPAENAARAETEGSKMVKMGSLEDDDDYDDDDDDDDDDDEDDEDEVVERSQNEHGHEEDDENEGRSSRKRARKGGMLASPTLSPSPLMRQLSSEVVSVMQDGTKSAMEKKQWVKSRMMALEEQRVSYQCKAFELEKQRLKWVKFSSKKEREMEREKLVNQRRRLENERMALLLRQKEVELLELHHQQQQQQQQQQQHSSSNKRPEPSSFPG